MASVDELFDLIRKSLPNRSQDAERLVGLMQTVAEGEVPVDYHLSAQNPKETEPVVLDVAMVTPRRVYSFTLLRNNNISIFAAGLKSLSAVSIRGEPPLTVVRLFSGGDVVLSFADTGDRVESLLGFVRTVMRLAWP